MIFASNLFLLYFLPVFVLLYLLCPQRYRNLLALAASLLFYAWGAPRFVFVLLGSSLLDFWLAPRLHGAEPGSRRLRLLFLGVSWNLLLLLYFKYANFFVDNVNALLGSMGVQELSWTAVVLPLGISFFTFQKLSYLIDVYRGVRAPATRADNYLLYVFLFPQLVAGPIVRYRSISEQLEDRTAQERMDFRLSGMWRFALGLARKVLIADAIAVEVNKIFALPPEQLDTSLAWLGPLGFAFVVYHDFAGYSDMALGLGRIMGFRLPENFNYPYIATSITDFWKRWHLTLTDWFRSYMFMPLRHWARRPWMLYLNLWLVFLAAGLWHGAAWTFVAFGAWHGTWLTLERLGWGKMLARLPRPFGVVWTFGLVVIGCVFFKAPDMVTASNFLQKMFWMDWSGNPQHLGDLGLFLGTKFWFLMGLAAVLSFWGLVPAIRRWGTEYLEVRTHPVEVVLGTLLAAALLTLCISEIATMGFRPFIYYMF